MTLGALVSLTLACSDAKKSHADSGGSAAPGGSAAAAAPASPPSTGATDASCPKEGNWAICSVEDRLVHAGLVVEKRDAQVHHDFFSVPGTAYQVGVKDDVVEIYIYPTVDARKGDTEKLDSATVSPKGTKVTWSAPPTLVMSNNMAAVILSLNDRTVERLALALGAGLPQPESKKD